MTTGDWGSHPTGLRAVDSLHGPARLRADTDYRLGRREQPAWLVSLAGARGVSQQARPVSLPSLVGSSDAEVEALVGKLEVWVLLDQSGSVFANFGDPANARAAAVTSVLRLLARSGPGATFGLVQWGSSAPEKLAIRAVDIREGRNRIEAVLASPVNLGGTDLALGVRTATELMRPLDEGRRRITVVVSDGIQNVDSDVRFALSDPDLGPVHLLLIDRSKRCTAEMELDWRSCQLESVTRLTTFTTRVVAHELAETIALNLGLQLGPELPERAQRSWWRSRTSRS